jgi:hypothetical protein
MKNKCGKHQPPNHAPGTSRTSILHRSVDAGVLR